MIMRHMCVSLLLAESAPPHVVQRFVGHSAIDITMTIYAHAPLGEKRTASVGWESASHEAAAVRNGRQGAPGNEKPQTRHMA